MTSSAGDTSSAAVLSTSSSREVASEVASPAVASPEAASPKAASPEARRIARNTRVAVTRLRRRLRDVTPDDALSPLQTAILIDLEKGDASTAAELATLEGVRPQSVATAIEGLQRRGFITRKPDPTDGRRQIIELSPTGHAAEAGHGAARSEWLAHRIDEFLSPEECAVLDAASALLDRIARS